MKKSTVVTIGLGVAAAVVVGGVGYLYVTGKKRLQVTDPTATPDVRTAVKAGWAGVTGTADVRANTDDATAQDPKRVAYDGIHTGDVTLGNRNSAETFEQLAVSGLYPRVS